MYLWSMDRLERAGYEQYEISNVARPGRASRHNLKYWRDGEWIGFGCGAHSTREGVRWKNVPATAEYIDRISAGRSVIIERRELTRDTRLEEALFTGLRLVEGIDIEQVGAKYGKDVWKAFGAALQPSLDAGLVVRDRARLRLTREGMLLANEILSVFV
jgi:oxygen-independent coproporphyrinogen-3 oxidase